MGRIVETWEVRRARYLAEKELPPDPAPVTQERKRKPWKRRGPWRLNPTEREMNQRAEDSLDRADRLRGRRW